MNRKERRIQKRRVRRFGVVLASVVMLGATAGLGGAAFAGGPYGNGMYIHDKVDGYNVTSTVGGTYTQFGILNVAAGNGINGPGAQLVNACGGNSSLGHYGGNIC